MTTPATFYRDSDVWLLNGDARTMPLPDASVDLIVTSPPYFGLRSYQDNGDHLNGQLGDEPTPDEFIDALLDATREMIRVLKPTGSIFVNLGDKYARTGGVDRKPRGGPGDVGNRKAPRAPQRRPDAIPEKSLIMIPARYAIRCIDELGLILRAEIIWHKPNGLPESVTDRVKRSHEQWFHFTISPQYFAAIDEIREPHLQPNRKRADVFGGATATNGVRHAGATVYTGPTNAAGKIPGSVWSVPTQPLTVPQHLSQHFAAFPMELPRRIIEGWSPKEICTVCKQPRRLLKGRDCESCGAFIPTQGKQCPECHHIRDWKAGRSQNAALKADDWSTPGHGTPRLPGGFSDNSRTNGYACACPDNTAPTRRGIVLDPFGGTGTTALVAKALGRRGISNDLSTDYCRVAQWRVNDEKELAKINRKIEAAQ